MGVPRISAVVVTYQSEGFIVDCLKSLAAQTAAVERVVVVDNGSTDATVRIVRDKFPEVRLIEMGANTGYCRANNVGLKEASGEFVLFANPDTILEPDYLERALSAFDGSPRIGMVAGKLLRFDRRTIDSAGQVLTISRKIQDRGFGQLDRGQFKERARVDGVCGAMALYRREMIDDISPGGELFDEDFFAFWEDMDVGWRARRREWEAVYEPSAVAYHFRGGSQQKHTAWTNIVRMSGRSNELKFHILKNRWMMLIKNETAADFLIHLPFILLRDIAVTGFVLLTSPSVLLRLIFQPGWVFKAIHRRRRLN